jgi:hypothetical protein
MQALTRCTKVVKGHGREVRVHFPVVPPTHQGILDFLDSRCEININLMWFLDAIHRDIKEVDVSIGA